MSTDPSTAGASPGLDHPEPSSRGSVGSRLVPTVPVGLSRRVTLEGAREICQWDGPPQPLSSFNGGTVCHTSITDRAVGLSLHARQLQQDLIGRRSWLVALKGSDVSWAPGHVSDVEASKRHWAFRSENQRDAREVANLAGVPTAGAGQHTAPLGPARAITRRFRGEPSGPQTI